MSAQSTGSLPAKYAVIFQEDQFYNLVLVDHMDGHVAGLGLRSQQCRSEHNGYALSCHPVLLSVFYHSKGKDRDTGSLRYSYDIAVSLTNKHVLFKNIFRRMIKQIKETRAKGKTECLLLSCKHTTVGFIFSQQ